MPAKPKPKRSFATITRMRSGRYQVRYTAPNGARLTAGRTFTARIDAEAWIVDKRREIEQGRWRAEHPAPITFAEYALTWLANRHVTGRPIKVR
ncbi:MAG: site-specific integrase, partial [Mycolicibacterium sp.]|nr:site-specific integrase [Mycolicibacterium sp.]